MKTLFAVLVLSFSASAFAQSPVGCWKFTKFGADESDVLAEVRLDIQPKPQPHLRAFPARITFVTKDGDQREEHPAGNLNCFADGDSRDSWYCMAPDDRGEILVVREAQGVRSVIYYFDGNTCKAGSGESCGVTLDVGDDDPYEWSTAEKCDKAPSTTAPASTVQTRPVAPRAPIQPQGAGAIR